MSGVIDCTAQQWLHRRTTDVLDAQYDVVSTALCAYPLGLEIEVSIRSEVRQQPGQSRCFARYRQRKRNLIGREAEVVAAQRAYHTAPAVGAGKPAQGITLDDNNVVPVKQGDFSNAVAEVTPLWAHSTGHEGGANRGIHIAGQIGTRHLETMTKLVGERLIQLLQGDRAARTDLLQVAIDDDFVLR